MRTPTERRTQKRQRKAAGSGKKLCALLRGLVQEHLHRLTDSEIRVLLVFMRYTDKHGIAYPSTELVARLAGISVRSVKRALAALAQANLIVDKGRKRHSNGQSTRLRKLLTAPRRSKKRGDTGVTKEVTLVSKRGDTGVTQTTKGTTEGNCRGRIGIECDDDNGGAQETGAPRIVDVVVEKVSPEPLQTQKLLRSLGVSAWRTLHLEVWGLTHTIVETLWQAAQVEPNVEDGCHTAQHVIVAKIRDRKWLPADEMRAFELRRDAKNAVLQEIGFPAEWLGERNARLVCDDRITASALKAELLLLPNRVKIDGKGQIVAARAADSRNPEAGDTAKSENAQDETPDYHRPGRLAAPVAAAVAGQVGDGIPF